MVTLGFELRVYCDQTCLTAVQRRCFSGLLEGTPPGNTELSTGAPLGMSGAPRSKVQARAGCTYPGHWRRLGAFPGPTGLWSEVTVVHLHVALQVLGTLELDAALGAAEAGAGPVGRLGRGQATHLSVGAAGHAAGAEAIGEPVDVELHQVLLAAKLFEAQGTLVQLLQPLAVGGGRSRAARQLLHVEGAMDRSYVAITH